MPNKIIPPAGVSAKDHYFNGVQGVSNSRLGEVDRWLQGNLDFVFPEKAAWLGNAVDGLLTQPESIDFTGNMELALKMAERAKKHPLVAMALRIGESQVIFTNWITIELGGICKNLMGKCMVDMSLLKHGVILDLKTTSAISQQAFRLSIDKFNYKRQSFWYMEITGADKMILVGIPKNRNEIYVEVIERGDERWEEGREQAHTLAYYHDIAA